MKFSVVIPTFNEASVIEDSVRHVQMLKPDTEIIIADGGSTDKTVTIARSNQAVVTVSERGRGIQQNAGASVASGDILVFLHSDTTLPDNTFEDLELYFTREGVNVGTFRMQFDNPHWLLKLYTLPCRLDLTFTRFGDQCIVVRREFFNSIGGFPNWRLFEDVKFINSARKHTRIHRFPGYVTTSARRFLRHGVIRQQLYNMWYLARYFLGKSPDELAELYETRKKRQPMVMLIIFARFPRAGNAKKRLGVDLGDENASNLYRLCAEQLFHTCEKFRARVNLVVSFASEEDAAMAREWVSPVYDISHQAEGDLGRKLINAFEEAFENSSQKVIVLASDVPQISHRIINNAIKSLDSNDMVIGPCHDGGYYLIGMKKIYEELFDDISWGTGRVYQQTRAIASRLGLKTYELPRLIDIDTKEDLWAWFNNNASKKSLALRNFAQKLVTKNVEN